MPAQNIFITGASGKIARFLIDSLKSRDYNIILLCRKKADESYDPKVKYIVGNILEPDNYAASLRETDTIIHMGAITHTNDISKYYEINSEGTLHLVKLCKYYGAKRFIFISTRAISEQGGDYSRSKSIAERHVQESGLDWVILRLAEVYGISGDKGLDGLLNKVHKFPIIPIIGDGEYTISPVYVSDVVFSIVKALEKTDIKNKIYNIAGPESFTYNEFVDKILKIKHSRGVKVHIPLGLFKIFLYVSAIVFKDKFLVMDQLPRLISKKSHDISLAKKDLCFKPIKIEDIISKDDRL